MSRHKLLIVTDNFLPRWDGIARFLVEVLPQLSKVYDVKVLAPDFPGASTAFPDVEIIRYKLSPFSANDFPFAYPVSKKMESYVKEADIVWVQTIAPLCWSAIRLAKKFNKPLVGYVHSIDWVLAEKSTPYPILNRIVGWVTRYLARSNYGKCDILMVPTQEVADIFEQEGISVNKVLIPMGINTDKFIPAADRSEVKKSLGIKPEEIVIGYCGRVSRDKDIMTLYKAFEWLNKKNKDVKLLIVGPGLENYMHMFKSKENIIVTGAKDDVIPYYQAMDIFVLPSLTETTALSILEAMSSGCCVVSTKVGVAQQLIENNENGFFFPKRNVTVLKKKLQWLIQNKESISQFGKRARITVMKHFSWSSTIESIERVLAQF
ncbi:MAG: glycosyltransferase family 4 protein [Candidatus Woesearchaeota archaeon]